MKIAQAIKARMIAADPAPRRPKMSLAAHRMFAPALGLWGAACGALCVIVLPSSLAYAIGAKLLPFVPFAWAKPALAVGVAIVMAALCYACARMVASGGRQRHAGDDLQPINAAQDLGSESLDAPLGESFGDQAAPANVYDLEYDLAEFAALPGRDAVWVAEAPGEPAAPPADELGGVLSEASCADVSAAIAKLRAVPPAELSLCEMVERFAAALHEYQSIQESEPAQQTREQSEALLGEALKALDIITRKGNAQIEASQGAAMPPPPETSQARGAAA